jgi:hypothetical protein
MSQQNVPPDRQKTGFPGELLVLGAASASARMGTRSSSRRNGSVSLACWQLVQELSSKPCLQIIDTSPIPQTKSNLRPLRSV